VNEGKFLDTKNGLLIIGIAIYKVKGNLDAEDGAWLKERPACE
jgi:hypothetical protein